MSWYALRVKAPFELRIAEDMRSAGAIVFVPVETVVRQARTAKGGTTPRQSIMPLVRGYVFATEPDTSHDKCLGCLMVDGAPYNIPEPAMRPLFEASGRTRHAGQRLRPLSIGEVVRLAEGPFDGREARIAKLEGGRITVSMPWLGAERLVRVTREQLVTP